MSEDLGQTAPIKKPRRVLFVVLLVVIVLLGVGAALWFVFSQQAKQTKSQDTGTQIVAPKDDPSVALQQKATTAAKKDGPDAGQKVFDDELKSTSDKAAQAQLYIQKATFAASPDGGNNPTLGVQYAQQAEKLAPTGQTAVTIGLLDEQAGDTKDAITYYKLYLSRMTAADKANNPGDYEYYSQHIKQLEAGQ